jgi:hypothetical protein
MTRRLSCAEPEDEEHQHDRRRNKERDAADGRRSGNRIG